MKEKMLARRLYLDEGIVKQEHNSGEIPDPSPAVV